MERAESIHRAMTGGRIRSLIIKLSIPNTLGLLVVAAYSLADSFFVSSLGTEAGAAVGVAFSLHVLVQAVGFTLGMGAGSLLSRALGRRDTIAASRYAAVAFLLSLVIGGAITALGLTFQEPLLRLLGARGDVLPMARAYVRPFLFAAPVMCAVFVLSQTLRAEGKAFYSMTGLLVGSALNVALDPLLITRFGMGIAGASTATLISQCASLCVLLSAYLFRRSALSLRVFRLRALAESGRIFAAGLPSLFRQGLSGVATVLLNHASADYGDAAVSAMSLVSRIFILVFSFCLGIGQGMMPVVGYNRGAGNTARVKKAYVFSMIAASAVMLAFSIPLFTMAPRILALFQNDAEAVRIGASALRAQSLVLFTHGLVTCTILYLQAIGHPVRGTVLASARQGIFFLPLIFILPAQLGLVGLEWAQPISDALTLLFALPFVRFAFRNLKKEEL
ncbi:MAG: MATE family efflux transporter [Clostridia bacterium]|nr:MATE family efflux transporter [Clostridia bacterium]